MESHCHRMPAKLKDDEGSPLMPPVSIDMEADKKQPADEGASGGGLVGRVKKMWRNSACMVTTCIIGLVISLGIFIRLMILLSPSKQPHVPSIHSPPHPYWSISPPPMPPPNAPCMQMGTASISGFKLSVRSCLQLWPGQAGIFLPQDNTTVKYGGLDITGLSSFNPPTATFIDQNGISYSVPAKAIPSYLPPSYSIILGQSLSQMIWKASLSPSVDSNGNPTVTVTSVRLNLFIDPAALVLPFTNSSFISNIFNSPPIPADISSSYWSRWDFIDRFAQYPIGTPSQVPAAQGIFVNLNQSIYNTTYARNNTSHQCERGLLTNQSTANETQWFSNALGNGTNLLLFWFPSMHAAFDSELVVVFSNGVTYMSALPPAYRLLAENVNTTRPYTFVIHGTPVGVLQSFSGSWHHHRQRMIPPHLC